LVRETPHDCAPQNGTQDHHEWYVAQDQVFVAVIRSDMLPDMYVQVVFEIAEIRHCINAMAKRKLARTGKFYHQWFITSCANFA